MSDITGYRVGGTIHLIINNQIGFTTAPEFARSSLYCSDVAKTVQAPIFHVNGDDPEACVRVARLAFEYRQRFHKDVVIDMWCYRRHGHNEGDDPSYTQPLMYKAIAEHRSVRKLYVETLVKRGDITLEEAEQALADFQGKLQVALDETRAQSPAPIKAARPPKPVGVLPHIATGVDRAVLDRIFHHLTEYPEGVHGPPEAGQAVRGPGRSCTSRARSSGRRPRRWRSARCCSTATACAWPARTPGGARSASATPRSSTTRPASRGSRSTTSTAPRAGSGSTTRCCRSTPRSASSTATPRQNPEALVLWEAQFGDFINGAQVIIDQYLVAAEDKWGQHNGLVLLLPHGYEGQGPEHSSARIERFLTPGRRGQHPGLQRHDGGAVLPPAAAPGAHRAAHAADRVHAEAGAADEADPLADRRADDGVVRGDPRRPVRHRPRRRPADRVLQRQGGVGRDGRARQARGAGRRRARRAAVPVADRPAAARCSSATRTPASSCGCRRSPRTWAPGASSSAACGGSRSAATTCATSPASSPAARPPAPRRSTTRSSPTSWTRRSSGLWPAHDPPNCGRSLPRALDLRALRAPDPPSRGRPDAVIRRRLHDKRLGWIR